jgi:hypothetical protein
MGRNIIFTIAALTLAVPLAIAGSLTGTVLDASTLTPVAGAIVTVHIVLPDSIALPDTSGSTGVYAVAGIPAGNAIYVIMASAPGYKWYYFRYDDLGTGDHSFDVGLEPESLPGPGGGGDSTTVAGCVLGRSSIGEAPLPIAGAAVNLNSGSANYTVLTGTDGKYLIEVMAGSYAISVSAQGYQPSGSSGIAVGVNGLSYGLILKKEEANVVRTAPDSPTMFRLDEAYPNPSNPTSVVTYHLPVASTVQLIVYDILGREVVTLVDGQRQAGSVSVRFDASGLPGGVYLYQLRAFPADGRHDRGSAFVSTKRLIVLK